VELNVLFHKRRDEIVTVVVARLHSEFQVKLGRSRGILELLRFEEMLPGVRSTSHDKSWGQNCFSGDPSSDLLLDQVDGRVLTGSLHIIAEILFVSIFTETRLMRAGNGRESRY
jgi:hypothetical protein